MHTLQCKVCVYLTQTFEGGDEGTFARSLLLESPLLMADFFLCCSRAFSSIRFFNLLSVSLTPSSSLCIVRLLCPIAIDLIIGPLPGSEVAV